MSGESSVWYRVLSERLVATGAPERAALDSVTTNPLPDGCYCWVSSGPGRGEWQLDRQAIDDPDGVTIVAPKNGPGRWFKKWVTGPGARRNSALPSIVYIDGDSGDDTNSGASPEEAFKTLAGLTDRCIGGLVPHNIEVRFIPNSVGYDPSPLGSVSGYAGKLKVVGLGVRDVSEGVSPLVALSGTTQTKLVVAASTWSPDEIYGYHLRCDTGANAGRCRTVLHHDAHRAWFHEFAEPIAEGDTFSVVRPAVKFVWSREVSIFGGVTTATYASDANFLSLFNIEIALPSDYVGTAFSGRVDLYGVVVTSTATEPCTSSFDSAYVRSGNTTWVDLYADIGYPDSAITGWGFSHVGKSKHLVDILNSKADLAGCVIEHANLISSNIDWQSGTFASYSDQPHGALLLRSSEVIGNGVSTSFLRTDDSAYASVIVDCGARMEFVGPVSQVGSAAAPMVVRYPGVIVFNNTEPTLTGQVQALLGGKVRLVDVDGASVALGFKAGYDGLETAMTFPTVGSHIKSVDGSVIYRTA